MNSFKDTTAIILAGGRSTRMGQDKGLMIIEGKSMIQYTIDTVSLLTENIILIANNPEYKKFGYPTYVDLIREKGPLAGIVTGLSASTTEKNWVLSCDTPYVQVKLLENLMQEIGEYDAIIPEFGGRMNPLIAVYKKSSMHLLQDQLDLERLKLTEATKSLNVNFFNANQFDLRNFKNLNTQADL